MYTYDYPRPSVTVDIVIMEPVSRTFCCVRRKNEPFKNCLALPGGFLEMNETSSEAAVRELKEETNIDLPIEKIVFLGVFDDVKRDPRGRVISMAFLGFVTPEQKANSKAGDDAESLTWCDIADVNVELAFDHKNIMASAAQRVIRELLSTLA